MPAVIVIINVVEWIHNYNIYMNDIIEIESIGRHVKTSDIRQAATGRHLKS